jgi:hypothetical protein
MKAKQLAVAMTLAGLMMGGCETNPSRGDPNNPSPTSGSDSSNRANEMADKAMYKPVEYENKGIKGPTLVVIPGEIKSNNATFTQKISSNNIADFAELELGNANFGILERSDMGPLMQDSAGLHHGRPQCRAQVPAKRQMEDHQVGGEVRHPEGRAGGGSQQGI